MERHSTQIALFYQTAFASSSNAIRTALIENFPDLDPQVVIYPIPQDAPAEIPRLEAKLGNLFVQFSNLRADIVLDTDELTTDIEQRFFTTVLKLGVAISRIGYISRRKFTQDGISIIHNLALNSGDRTTSLPFNDLLEANWRVNKRTDLDGTICNNLSTITLMNDKTSVLLERDVNNNPNESPLSLRSSAELTSIVERFKSEAAKDLGLIP